MPLDEISLKADLDAEAATESLIAEYDQAYYQALLDVAKGSLDRSHSAAELVQKSAAAIGTLYVGVLGVSFSVSNHRLPLRGIIPAIFLGLAIGLSVAYVAYIRRPSDVDLDPLHTSPPERLQRRLNNFYKIITEGVQRRGYYLRASVIALGVGVVLLPVPFITFDRTTTQNLPTQPDWPSRPSVASAPAASLEAIVFKAKVDEVEAARREAQLEPSEPDPLAWFVVTVVGLILVFGVPRLGEGST